MKQKLLLFIVFVIILTSSSILFSKNDLVVIIPEKAEFGHYVLIFNSIKGIEINNDSVFFNDSNIIRTKVLTRPKLLNNVVFLKQIVHNNTKEYIKLSTFQDYNCNSNSNSIFGIHTGTTFTNKSQYLLFLYGNCDSAEIYLNKELKTGFDD